MTSLGGATGLGGMAERLKASVLKTEVRKDRGFDALLAAVAEHPAQASLPTEATESRPGL